METKWTSLSCWVEEVAAGEAEVQRNQVGTAFRPASPLGRVSPNVQGEAPDHSGRGLVRSGSHVVAAQTSGHVAVIRWLFSALLEVYLWNQGCPKGKTIWIHQKDGFLVSSEGPSTSGSSKSTVLGSTWKLKGQHGWQESLSQDGRFSQPQSPVAGLRVEEGGVASFGVRDVWAHVVWGILAWVRLATKLLGWGEEGAAFPSMSSRRHCSFGSRRSGSDHSASISFLSLKWKRLSGWDGSATSWWRLDLWTCHAEDEEAAFSVEGHCGPSTATTTGC